MPGAPCLGHQPPDRSVLVDQIMGADSEIRSFCNRSSATAALTMPV